MAARSLDLLRTRLGRAILCATLLTFLPVGIAPIARGEAPRFSLSRVGISDARTGLTWRRGAPRFLPWRAARDHCTDLDGRVGWRLPSIDELADMVARDVRVGSFALVREVFGRATGTAYWSRSTRGRRDTATPLAFDEDGTIDEVHPEAALAVRCVRRSAR